MTSSDKLAALFEAAPPRQGPLVAKLIRGASQMQRVAFFVALGLGLVLAALILSSAKGAKELMTMAPSAVVVVVLLQLPFVLYLQRARSKMRALVVFGERGPATIKATRKIKLRHGPLIAYDIAYRRGEGGEEMLAQLQIPGSKPLLEPGDELSVLTSSQHPGVVLTYADAWGAKPARAITAEQAAPKTRLLRLAIGVVIGSALFALYLWLFAR